MWNHNLLTLRGAPNVLSERALGHYASRAELSLQGAPFPHGLRGLVQGTATEPGKDAGAQAVCDSGDSQMPLNLALELR